MLAPGSWYSGAGLCGLSKLIMDVDGKGWSLEMFVARSCGDGDTGTPIRG